jgi:hypothetical protein
MNWLGKNLLFLIIGLVCFIILTPLCYIRDLTSFSRYHALADLIIISTVLMVLVFAFLQIG